MIGIPRCLDRTIRSPAAKRIYTAVIRRRMEYACAVWSGGPTGCLQCLHDSFAKGHSLSLPPLEKRFEYHTLVLFYRVRANLATTYLSSLVPPLTSTKSGYSFRKKILPCPPHKKVCNVKQLFAPCNPFMECSSSKGAVIKHLKIDWELTFRYERWHRFSFFFLHLFYTFFFSLFLLPSLSVFVYSSWNFQFSVLLPPFLAWSTCSRDK